MLKRRGSPSQVSGKYKKPRMRQVAIQTPVTAIPKIPRIPEVCAALRTNWKKPYRRSHVERKQERGIMSQLLMTMVTEVVSRNTTTATIPWYDTCHQSSSQSQISRVFIHKCNLPDHVKEYSFPNQFKWCLNAYCIPYIYTEDLTLLRRLDANCHIHSEWMVALSIYYYQHAIQRGWPRVLQHTIMIYQFTVRLWGDDPHCDGVSGYRAYQAILAHESSARLYLSRKEYEDRFKELCWFYVPRPFRFIVNLEW